MEYNWIYVVTFLLTALVNKGLGSDDEHRLVKYLFDQQGYNPLIRPVANLSDKLTIKFGLTMIQLINVDEKNQIMKTNVWLQMVWTDYQLQWDPADYGGISAIRLPPEKVWTPDIVLFNNADGKYEVSYGSNVVIYNDGSMLRVPPSIYQSTCEIDVRYFPFDEQECLMSFGSWTFSVHELGFDWYPYEHMTEHNESFDQIDFEGYMPSAVWDVMSGTGKITVQESSHGHDGRTRVNYIMKLRRKTLFYLINLIIPVILIAFLTTTVFYLPSEAFEKITLSISILIAITVFILLVSKILPPTSLDVPLISRYLLFMFIMNCVSVLASVVIINWHFRYPTTHCVPYWVRVVFLRVLPTLIIMKRPNHMKQYGEGFETMFCETKQKQKFKGLQVDESKEVQMEQTTLNANGKPQGRECKLITKEGNCKLIEENNPISKEYHEGFEALDYIEHHIRQQKDWDRVLEDWKFVAMVIDRLLLYIFVSVTIAGTVVIITQPPSFYEATSAAIFG